MEELGKRRTIGDLLIEYKKITRKDLEEGLRLQKESNIRIGEALIKLGRVTKDDIEWVLSKQLNIPFVIVENISLDRKLIGRFSEELLMNNGILPLYETSEEIAIATDEPLNTDVFESMERFANKKIRLSAGNGEKIRELLGQFFRREGVPTLVSSIRRIVEMLTGTSFYRIDFVVNENSCEINAYGFGLLKNMAVLREPYSKEEVLESFSSLDMGFLYDEYSNGNISLLSVIPLLNRLENISFPAIVGAFGLFLPETTAFADMEANSLPLLVRSEGPVPGYVFISARPDGSVYQKAVYTIDSAPENFKDFYVNVPVAEMCGLCRGKGCSACRDLGYVFLNKLDGIYSSEDLFKIFGVRRWQR